MIPWFPGGHADPWNHIEAAMALAIGEHRAEAEAAYQWLVDCQRPDGSWHQYYLEHEIEQDKLDANVIAYIATGVWHHFLLYRDQGFIESMWPVVDQAIRFVLDLQQPRGEILWARHPDGTPWSFALLTGSSSIAHFAALLRSPRSSDKNVQTGSFHSDSLRMRSATSGPRRSHRSIVGRWTGTTRCCRA